ncbi:MAG TPA: Tim44/TimA family putative adaptor protein [Stellaceae bacterium]|jgi:predicted lipid-binding transport protein (Tim44 family)|nr:Tim44/TimA family putative adaptor protein [Stellaceae bacterium]
MGDLPHYFDIILFAMVAGFLILRLRSVLGRRTGHERRPDAVVRRADAPSDNKVVAFGGRAPVPPLITATPADAVAVGLERIRGVDAAFDPTQFLEGARAAFEMIVGAFAAGDTGRLRPLLSDDVYTPFSEAIDERRRAGETLETQIVKLKSLDIAEAGLAGRTARVTAKFVSDQINVLRAHDSSIVDGDPGNPVEKTDLWTFARDTRSSDPNWVLVATAST